MGREINTPQDLTASQIDTTNFSARTYAITHENFSHFFQGWKP